MASSHLTESTPPHPKRSHLPVSRELRLNQNNLLTSKREVWHSWRRIISYVRASRGVHITQAPTTWDRQPLPSPGCCAFLSWKAPNEIRQHSILCSAIVLLFDLGQVASTHCAFVSPPICLYHYLLIGLWTVFSFAHRAPGRMIWSL